MDMGMTKESIEKIQELSNQAAGDKRIIRLDDRNYQVDNNGNVNLIIPENLSKRTVNLSTLSGLVELVKNMGERNDSKLFIQVLSPTEVKVFGAIDEYGRRENLIITNAMIPRFNFDDYYDAESLNIALQSRFVTTNDREIILQVIGNLKEEAVHTSSDDGVSQSVQIKSGVASVDEVKVPNPVSMKPYRTFTEVDQPESDFIFRMRKGMEAALFEADGGAWKNEAMNNIKNYLDKKLDDEIQTGHVTVIA